VDHAGEPLHNPPDLGLYLRSRMQGVLGLCFRIADFSDGETADLVRQIALYAALRYTLTASSATLLTQQADSAGGPAWDVLQARDVSGASLVLTAFQVDAGVTRTNVKPRDLDPAMTYDIRSVDQGSLGSATGADLMTNGIDIVASPVSAAHILVLTAR
jgi:hypothetical protein